MRRAKRRAMRLRAHHRKKLRRVLKRRRQKRKRRETRRFVVPTLTNQLLGLLARKGYRARPARRHREKRVEIHIPEIFCFSENPDETIRTIRRVYDYAMNTSVQEMHFDHTQCRRIGLCASAVMDVIFLAVLRNREALRKPLKLSGDLPKSKNLQDILRVSGLLKHLGLKHKVRGNIETLPLIESRNADESSITATRIVEYYDRCLGRLGFRLTREGKDRMGGMVGEVVNNCEIHGGPHSQWFALGHYHLYDEEEYGEISLVIFDIGDTIYEGLKAPSASEETKSSLAWLTRRHKGPLRRGWDEETLWTLFALQEGVSRKRDSTRAPDRGVGTVTLIESFLTLGQSKDDRRPVMSITSGRAHIYFDGSYKLQRTIVNGETRRVIAFNAENDLTKLPDPRYVRRLQEYFPGTVISMNFFVDANYIEAHMGGARG